MTGGGRAIWAEWQRQLLRWQSEHASVADDAARLNLRRVRWLAPMVALLNAVHIAVLGLQLLLLTSDTPAVRTWKFGLVLTHLCMGGAMACCALAAHHLRHASRRFWGWLLPMTTVALAMVFAIAIVAIDQWVTPNITPFLITCLVVGAAFHLRPLPSLALFIGAYVLFYQAVGLTQPNAGLLLSNRLNGITACLMGWALAVVLWRNFTQITLQQRQLADINTALQDRQKELERLTRRDGLTGLFNRHTFVQLTEQELARARRQGGSTTVLLLDLDHFKRINDTHGHPAGDAVLRQVAALLTETVRSTDLVGRLGGEEFIVLLPGTTATAGRNLAEKLRARIEGAPAQWQDVQLPATASIGVADAPADRTATFESLYSAADQALYQAKTRGRNRVV